MSVSAVYGTTCYLDAHNCVCVNIGDCYGEDTPTGCTTPTCIIADSTGTTDNVCEGAGPFSERTRDGDCTCEVSSCRIWNNCTFQYEAPPGGCNFTVPQYRVVPSSTPCP